MAALAAKIAAAVDSSRILYRIPREISKKKKKEKSNRLRVSVAFRFPALLSAVECRSRWNKSFAETIIRT